MFLNDKNRKISYRGGTFVYSDGTIIPIDLLFGTDRQIASFARNKIQRHLYGIASQKIKESKQEADELRHKITRLENQLNACEEEISAQALKAAKASFLLNQAASRNLIKKHQKRLRDKEIEKEFS